MKTQYEQLIGDATILSTATLTGPRGGTWKIDYLSDGRIGLHGPHNQDNMNIPQWIRKHYPYDHELMNAGGTAYKERRYISRIKQT